MGLASTGFGTGLTAMLLLAMAPAAWSQSQSDIVWPTYDQAARPSDPGLNCAALGAEIAHVGSDISLLRKAQVRVEEVLHSAFDMARYGGAKGPGGMRISGTDVSGQDAYIQARGQIVASLKVALTRRDRLKSLEPDCKPGPQPVSTP
jgi:hypothetical protein